jgi:hypothetical protein
LSGRCGSSGKKKSREQVTSKTQAKENQNSSQGTNIPMVTRVLASHQPGAEFDEAHSNRHRLVEVFGGQGVVLLMLLMLVVAVAPH